jgi:hypothetical protein
LQDLFHQKLAQLPGCHPGPTTTPPV